MYNYNWPMDWPAGMTFLDMGLRAFDKATNWLVKCVKATQPDSSGHWDSKTCHLSQIYLVLQRWWILYTNFGDSFELLCLPWKTYHGRGHIFSIRPERSDPEAFISKGWNQESHRWSWPSDSCTVMGPVRQYLISNWPGRSGQNLTETGPTIAKQLEENIWLGVW